VIRCQGEALQGLHDSRLSRLVDADKDGEAAGQIDRCRGEPEATEIGQDKLFNEHRRAIPQELRPKA
jgi:hypothetical protein